jgi:hypothetical protein
VQVHYQNKTWTKDVSIGFAKHFPSCLLRLELFLFKDCIWFMVSPVDFQHILLVPLDAISQLRTSHCCSCCKKPVRVVGGCFLLAYTQAIDSKKSSTTSTRNRNWGQPRHIPEHFSWIWKESAMGCMSAISGENLHVLYLLLAPTRMQALDSEYRRSCRWLADEVYIWRWMTDVHADLTTLSLIEW